MKAVVTIIVLILVGLGVFMYFSPGSEEVEVTEGEGVEEIVEEGTERVTAEDGSYVVVSESSIVNWSGQKPLVEGYLNTGTLQVTEGALVVAGASSTGSFEIDMNTLSVSETKAKPGAESLLGDHLKGENWFNVEEYPTASFDIVSVTPTENTEDSFLFDVVGELTMKGETGELAFPARIYQNESGQLVAEAELEFDRTRWGITAGSGSFFDNLADNVVDDMIKLSFTLVAEPQDDAMMEEGAAMEEETEEEEE